MNSVADPSVSSHLPIHENPMFPQGLVYVAILSWRPLGLTSLTSLLSSGVTLFKPFSELMQEYHLPPNHAFYYHHQLCAYIKSNMGVKGLEAHYGTRSY